MPYAGAFSAVNPGELISFSIDFGPQLATGDSINNATSAVTAFVGTDANAAALAINTPTITGTIISQFLGGAAPGGFQVGVTYSWTVTAYTTQGMTLINYAHVPCLGIS